MRVWQFANAQAKLEELVDLCLSEGPQTIVMEDGESVVVVPTKLWKYLIGGGDLDRYDPASPD